MMLFDMWFYTELYRLKSGRLCIEFNDRVFGVVCIYIPFFMATIACIIGLIKDNVVSQLFIHNEFLFSVITSALTFIFFAIRYYKFVDIKDMEKKILAQSKNKQKFFKYITYFLLIAVPVGLFVFYRLYKFGYV